MFQLKSLTPAGIPAALEKAFRYRMLNEPEQAESICEDVLSVDSENQDALTTLILAHADRLYGPRPVTPQVAKALLPKLKSEYDRAYFAGIIEEREGIAWLRSGKPRSGIAAYSCLRAAMRHFAAAEKLRPAANDDALLRWNSCARMILANEDVAPADDGVDDTPAVGD